MTASTFRRLELALASGWLLAVVVTHSDAGVPFPIWMVLFVAGLVVGLWCLARTVWAFAGAREARRRGLLLSSMVLLGILTAAIPWPLAIRLALSASSLRRDGPAAAAQDDGRVNAWIGLFHVREAARFGDELRFLTSECGLVDQCGIVYSPAGRPPRRGEDTFTHIYGAWWHWYQSW
jgi:hypothetical protein